MLQLLCHFLFFKIWRWRIEGQLPPDHPKYVLAVAPHTSNWDFIIGIVIRKAMSWKFMRFFGKAQLFRFPIGWWFKSLGGYPLTRSKSINQVQQIINYFNQYEDFVGVIAPEGTRKKVKKFRTGFYYIAKGAGIPIVLVSFDYPQKAIVIRTPFFPSEDAEQDLAYIQQYFQQFKGKYY